MPAVQHTHPVEVFLRGVLEGLLAEDEAALAVEVAPEALALSVETLLYCSQVVHHIVTPLNHPLGGNRRPGGACDPLPALTVRLQAHRSGRYVLTLADNGRFFRDRLPGIRLGMEALAPLVGLVTRNHGSIRLAWGRAIAFEITG